MVYFIKCLDLTHLRRMEFLSTNTGTSLKQPLPCYIILLSLYSIGLMQCPQLPISLIGCLALSFLISLLMKFYFILLLLIPLLRCLAVSAFLGCGPTLLTGFILDLLFVFFLVTIRLLKDTDVLILL